MLSKQYSGGLDFYCPGGQFQAIKMCIDRTAHFPEVLATGSPKQAVASCCSPPLGCKKIGKDQVPCSSPVGNALHISIWEPGP